MSNIRDEFGKMLDIRIPPNGYRRYIKEIGRTGGFQDTQRDDSIIILAQAVEDLQHQLAELQAQPVTPDPDWRNVPAALPVEHSNPPFICEPCGMEFAQRIALEGHKRSKSHKDAITNTAKRDSQESLQSK